MKAGVVHVPHFLEYQKDTSAPLAYCRCKRAIVYVAGVWWHLQETKA